MSVAILGAGAFGTALACALGQVTLWTRDADHARDMADTRENTRRLPGIPLPGEVQITHDLAGIDAQTLLLAMPMQAMRGFLHDHGTVLQDRVLVACSKGVDLDVLLGPVGVIRQNLPDARAALLTGPSFAHDIARGLPTALTLACEDPELGMALQQELSTNALRLYRNTDVTGAELGGALKNVIAIAAGMVIGADMGESARAALMARGYAEMQRLALALGAQADTLAGLSGLGDLILTCGSEKSRNFRYGLALGSGAEFDTTTTVEGAATARAVARLAQEHGIDMPITRMVAAMIEGYLTVTEARDALLARPLTEE
ncbi:NAD(P)H-dependent glycerol-3-phosphate dehydrogenase [Roseinatronobacter alkalisoli]|uniref:Glycerol-3-phosphate dehydrogenase [NAD(P)+] n=1 Tax=Roseinatronobacter alkalisoli TaxID=3028235 RepID=A0ABT5T8H9_9RHOB|nr:NAD(P)H-dependent glycerol-3-phosphate dehydrogenase [Roseinatronobacter sp. HJB301]MDD7971429.1 NAD(P)-dependent glycerol-3-phosphate dehydrogenase [Roseinatronobacter sp. HJB301]